MNYFKVIKLKEIVKITIFCIILIFLLTFSKENFICVQKSIELFLYSVLPSLFPFIFFTNFVLNTNLITLLKKYIGKPICSIFRVNSNSITAILIGFLCGFPMGAKTVISLYEKHLISRKDSYILLSFVNNCNPQFILSTIGIGIFCNIKIGIILLISHYISAIILGILASIKYSKVIISANDNILNSFLKSNDKNIKKETKNLDFFDNIKTSILNTFVNLSLILSFIIIFNLLFSTLNILLIKINVNENLRAIISAIFEITSGSKNIYEILSITPTLKLCIISFSLGFSGLCILFQIYSMISHLKFKLSSIFISKFIQGIFSAILTYILITFTNIIDITSLQVFSSVDMSYSNYLNSVGKSYLNSSLFVILGLAIYLIIISLNSYKK